MATSTLDDRLIDALVTTNVKALLDGPMIGFQTAMALLPVNAQAFNRLTDMTMATFMQEATSQVAGLDVSQMIATRGVTTADLPRGYTEIATGILVALKAMGLVKETTGT